MCTYGHTCCTRLRTYMHVLSLACTHWLSSPVIWHLHRILTQQHSSSEQTNKNTIKRTTAANPPLQIRSFFCDSSHELSYLIGWRWWLIMSTLCLPVCAHTTHNGAQISPFHAVSCIRTHKTNLFITNLMRLYADTSWSVYKQYYAFDYFRIALWYLLTIQQNTHTHVVQTGFSNVGINWC